MLFKPEHVPMILSGRKTETRRFWKKPRVKAGGIYKCKTIMLSTKYFAKIRVLKLYKQELQYITKQNVYNEGYGSLEDFKKIWIEINGVYNPKANPYVVEFELIKNG